jgi:glycosidase
LVAALKNIMIEPWWKTAVIYQSYPRSLQDSGGDGVGELPGIIRRLPYLAELGVDALWVSPIFPSPMREPQLYALRPPPMAGRLAAEQAAKR